MTGDLLNAYYDCYSVLNKVYSEKAFFKQALADTPIEQSNKPLIVKICYGVLDKDIELSYYIKFLADKSPKLVIRTILKISMYSIKYLDKKPYAVIDNAVSLTKKLGKAGMSGFVNAVLRKFIKCDIPLPEKQNEYLSVKYSFPLFAVDKLLKVYGYDRCENIIKTPNAKTTLVFYDVDGEKYLEEKGYGFQKTPFENVFSLDNFVRNDDFDKGFYTYQALGSVAICDMITPCDKLLDCCSAPGGKSVRLSYKCNDISSWDIHEHRVELIKSYATRMGRHNINMSVCDSKVYHEKYDAYFDGVLCDAPCSGLGVVNDNPDIKLNREEQDIVNLNKEQLAILNNVCKYVKVGGYLYYSTCSILKQENSDIIEKFLQTHKNYEYCESESKLPNEKAKFGINFLPDISMGLGFFFAKLKRIK